MKAKTYKFTQPWRQFQIGDEVPSEFDAGVVGTLLQVHKIQEATEPSIESKNIRRVPKDKIIHREMVNAK